jgi:hypothetical protein
MQSTSESKHSGANERGPTGPAPTKRRIRMSRHYAAQTRAGARALVRALQPFGVMRKSTLRHQAGAEHWHDYEFESALRAAVETGVIRRLPFGFYAKKNDADRALHEHHAKMGVR